MKTTNSTIRIIPGTLFALAFFVGVFFSGQNSISSFFTVPVAHAQYDSVGGDDGSGDSYGGGSSYYDGSGDSYDNNSGYYDDSYYNDLYDSYGSDPTQYTTYYDNNSYDYGNCSTGCGSYTGYTDYNNYDYGSYNYTTPTYYQTPTYIPPTIYPLPHTIPNPPTVNCPSGYTLQGNTCVPPVSGCPNGYTLQNNTCVPPIVQQPIVQPPVYQQPIYQQPIYQQPIVQQPIYQQPISYLPPAPQGPYVSLSQVPYTGLDLGPVGTVVYWTFLVLWCLFCAYLIAVKRIQNRFVSWMKTFLFGTKKSSSKTVATQTTTVTPSVVVAPDSGVDDFIFKQIYRAKA